LAIILPTGVFAEEPSPPKMSLAEAVNHAIARNPTSEVATAEARRAEAIVEEVRAASLPTLFGYGTYTRLDGDRLFNGRIIAPADAVSANLTLTVPIFAPKPWVSWSHAKDNVEIAKLSAVDIRRQVAIVVGRGYLSVVAQKRVIEAAEHARDTAKAQFDYAHQRLVGGVGNRIDEVRAAQELATDEASVQQAYAGLARLREALGVLVGLGGPIDTEEPSLGAPSNVAVAMQEAEKRSDVLTANQRVKAAEHVVRDDWTEYSPYITGIAEPFYQNPASLTQPLTGWLAQLVLTVPIYDGGYRYGLNKEREELATETRINLEAALRQARAEVRTGFETVRRADDALKAARDASQLATQALELAQLAYRAGATTNLEVIDAERRARDAETQVAVAEDGARQARLDLLAATGRFP
jgi:outer membrane protein TolC